MPMRDSKPANRGWGLPVLLVVGFLVFIAFADVAPLRTQSYLLEAQKSKAQLGCMSLATASQKYVESEANAKHELPNILRDLIQPPFGGPPFLGDGEADLIDPWGKPYELERAKKPNGDEYILVK